jgi:ATPase subunit of ABC transporter with duplicated ATPase domains
LDTPDAVLQVRNLRAGYKTPVVGPVSFSLRQGELLGVWGPNGSGKTTILSAISGTARIFEGEIEKRSGIRISHQHQSSVPLNGIPLTGRELLGLTGAEIDSLPPWVKPRIDFRLDRLSGGQQQFLQIWACLKAPVDIVLLDEPTNNLDPEGIKYLEAAVRTMKNGRAIILVSHDRRFVDAVCTRVMEIS